MANAQSANLQNTRNVMLKSPQREVKNKMEFKDWWNKYGIGYAFMAPYLILLFTFTILPVFVSAGFSLTYFNMLQPAKWIGFTNFRNLFLEDDIFLIALRNTFTFALVTGPIGYFASLFFAWVINQLKYNNGFALAFYAPSLCAGIAIGQVWKWFFDGDKWGLINSVLLKTGIIIEPILWMKNPDTILPVVMLVNVWMSMGTGFLVFLAGLQNIPRDLYEAGSIDGIQNKFQELWYITLPRLKPQLLFGAINAITGSFAVFDITVSLAGFPSFDYHAHTIVGVMQDHAFLRFEMGYASAVAVVLFLLTFTAGRVCFKLLRSND